MTDTKTFTEMFNCMEICKVFSNDAQNEKKAVRSIRNNRVRKNGMSTVAAMAHHSGNNHRSRISNRTMNKINEITFIGTMDGAVTSGLAVRTGFEFNPEILHEGMK
jgi:hypothetical protein